MIGESSGSCVRCGSSGYCQRVNSELVSHLSDERLSAYDRYLKVYKFIVDRDRELGEAFNDFRRSTALIQIRIIRGLGVIKDEELARFSDSTREFIVAEFLG